MNYHEWRQSKEYIKVSTGLDLSSASKFNQAIEIILEAAFNAGKRLNQVNAPDSLKPGLLEGVAYSMECVDAETVVFTRCR